MFCRHDRCETCWCRPSNGIVIHPFLTYSNRSRNLTVVGAVISSQVIWQDQDVRDRDEGCDVGLNFTIPDVRETRNKTIYLSLLVQCAATAEQ